MKYLLLVSWLIALPALAQSPLRQAEVKVKITRSYAVFEESNGEIRYETVCEKNILVPVFDSRENGQNNANIELTCASLYRDQPVNLQLQGRIEILPADRFQLQLPAGSLVKRTYFTLSAEGGVEFPYLRELPSLAGWQFFTEDLDLKSQIFLLSPPEFLAISCQRGICDVIGPQSIYRAQVKINEL